MKGNGMLTKANLSQDNFIKLQHGNSENTNRKFTEVQMEFVPQWSRKILLSPSVFQGDVKKEGSLAYSAFRGFLCFRFVLLSMILKILKLLKYRKLRF